MKKFLIKRIQKNKSLKSILIIPFLLQLFGVVTIVGYLSFKNGQQGIQSVSNKLLSQITNRVEDKLKNITSTAVIVAKLNAKNIKIDRKKNKSNKDLLLLNHFKNQLTTFQHIGLVSWGTEDGIYYGSFKDEHGTIFKGFSNTFEDPFFDYVKTISPNIEKPDFFDVRTREWYQNGLKKGKATWGDTFYTIFGNNWKTLTYSYPVYDQNQKIKGVLGINLHLCEFDKFLNNLNITKNSQVFVIDRSGLMVSTSTSNDFLCEEATSEILHISKDKNLINRKIGEILATRFKTNINLIEKEAS